MANIGDVDGSGQNDLMVGAYFEETNGYRAGAAYLLLGEDILQWRFDCFKRTIEQSGCFFFKRFCSQSEQSAILTEIMTQATYDTRYLRC